MYPFSKLKNWKLNVVANRSIQLKCTDIPLCYDQSIGSWRNCSGKERWNPQRKMKYSRDEQQDKKLLSYDCEKGRKASFYFFAMHALSRLRGRTRNKFFVIRSDFKAFLIREKIYFFSHHFQCKSSFNREKKFLH